MQRKRILALVGDENTTDEIMTMWKQARDSLASACEKKALEGLRKYLIKGYPEKCRHLLELYLAEREIHSPEDMEREAEEFKKSYPELFAEHFSFGRENEDREDTSSAIREKFLRKH